MTYFKARRFALRKEPPAIYLEYLDAQGKTRVRTVHVNHLSPREDALRLADKVIRAFPRKLDPSTVKKEQIVQLVERLLHHANSPHLIPSTTPKLPPPHLKPKEEEDEEVFEEDFIEEEVEEEEEEAPWSSKKPTASPMQVQEPLADDLDDMLADLDRELGSGGGATSKPAPLPPIPAPVAPLTSIPRFTPPAKKEEEEDSDFLVLDVDIGEDVDLNRATDVELKMAKQKMDENFSKNRLKPGDPGFEYDKQVEFGPPTAKNEWDDDDDDDDEVAPTPKLLSPPIMAASPPPPAPAAAPVPAAHDEEEDDRYSYGNDIDRVMEDDEEEDQVMEEEEIDDEFEGAAIGFDDGDDDDVFGEDDDLELP